MASDYVAPRNVQQVQVPDYGAVALCVCDTGICPVTSILDWLQWNILHYAGSNVAQS